MRVNFSFSLLQANSSSCHREGFSPKQSYNSPTCHCEAQPKQSYINVNEITASGLRPPRNDKTGSSHCDIPLVIARLRQQPKQSYISVNEIATGTTSPRNDKTGNVIASPLLLSLRAQRSNLTTILALNSSLFCGKIKKMPSQ